MIGGEKNSLAQKFSLGQAKPTGLGAGPTASLTSAAKTPSSLQSASVTSKFNFGAYLQPDSKPLSVSKSTSNLLAQPKPAINLNKNATTAP